MAYVVRAASPDGLTEDQVIQFVAGQVTRNFVSFFCGHQSKKHCFNFSIRKFQVAPYKKVRRVGFISAIPRSPASKILRKELVNLQSKQQIVSRL